ncbi:MAG TPA: pilus assembly protein PilM [Clostridia bacterium]|nr:pilus assembly protein PilM [Clostridia bacterium]
MVIKRMAGIEFTDAAIRVVEIYGSEKSHKITTLGSIDLAEGTVVDGVIVNVQAATAALADLIRKFSIKSKEITFGVDNKYVLVRYADIEKSSEKSLAKDVDEQIQQFLPVDKSSVVTDYFPLNEIESDDGEKKVKTLIVAAGKKMLNDYIEVFKGCRLTINDIDVNTIAIHRLLSSTDNEKKGTALINFKKEMFNLLILSDGKPLLARNMTVDTSNAVDENDFVNEYFESIRKDITSSLSYYNSITRDFIDIIYITGYGVWNENMVQFLRESTSAEIKVINPFLNERNKTGTPEVSRPYEYAVAYVLAQRGLESD